MNEKKKSVSGWAQLQRVGREMREGTYLANAQARKRASRTPWDVLGFLIFLLIWPALWLAGMQLGVELLHVFRPTAPDASIGFGYGLKTPETFAGIVLMLSPMLVAAACAFWLANVITYSIPRARQAQVKKMLADAVGFEEAQAGLAVAAMLGFAVYVVLMSIALLLA